uniref:Amino acid transporter transmembrane domain-containing protein n=1 Tax=Opuntia streptacantha TaxID=393608 RepID=A0A7C8ZDC2_OPUST
MSPPAGAIDAGVPLLPTNLKRQKDDGASVSGAVFNVSTSIIGAGIMSIPATLKVLGVVPALSLMIIVAFLADLSVEFLLRYTFSGEKRTYAGVMGESFGRVGSVLVQIFVMMLNWGCLIVYLIIIGDVLSGNQLEDSVHLGVLQEWFGPQWWTARPYAILFVLIFVLLPLVLYRRVESLRFSSAVSVLLAVGFVAICLGMAISAFIQGKTERPRLFPLLNGRGSFFELFTAVPVIVTAFTFHFNVHPISAELGKQSKMTKATKISVILCAAIYFGVGISGYLLFGDSIVSDILVNFDRSSESPLLNDLVRLSYALHLVLVFPLLNFSLRGNVDELLFPGRSALASDNTRFLSFTFVILALTYFAAIAIPDIWIFFQYVGSTAAVSLSLIFPAAITLRDVRGISSTKDKVIAALMVILAFATSVIAITANIVNIK